MFAIRDPERSGLSIDGMDRPSLCHMQCHWFITIVTSVWMGCVCSFHAPLRDNIPVILGLLGFWNSTFLGYPCRAVLPYSEALRRFPEFVQQVDMESNGKRVALDGTCLLHKSAEINFGGAGTSCQSHFIQLLHQGRVVPADFIGFMESSHDVDLPDEPVSNHDELMSNFFAQPDALAYGKTLLDCTLWQR